MWLAAADFCRSFSCVYRIFSCDYCTTYKNAVDCDNIWLKVVRINMIKQLASSIAHYSIAHNWIDESYIEWCQYTMEKQIGKLIFGTICLLLMGLTQTWFEVITFVLTFYLFRERLGGWHAKHYWSCQAISIGVVALSVFIIGPLVNRMSLPKLIILDAFGLLITYFTVPLYPTAVHFSDEIKHSNTKQKNVLLLIFTIAHALTITIWDHMFLTYSLIALVIADLSVLLLYLTSKREDD